MSATRKAINYVNITVLGNFNPAILKHDFLVKVCGFDLDPPVRVSPQVPMVTELQYRVIRWFMDFDRMIVEEKDLGEFTPFRCGEFAQKYLEVLPHTPVRAVGANLNVDYHFSDLAILWENVIDPERVGRIMKVMDTDSVEVAPRYVVSGGRREVQEARISYFSSRGPKVLLLASPVEGDLVRMHFNCEVPSEGPGPTAVDCINRSYLSILDEFQRLTDLVSREAL